MDSLRLRSVTIVAERVVDIKFDADDGSTVTHRFIVDDTGPITVTNGDGEFVRRYRGVPGPVTPTWPERLAAAAWRAACEPLPAGQALEDLTAEADAKRHGNQ